MSPLPGVLVFFNFANTIIMSPLPGVLVFFNFANSIIMQPHCTFVNTIEFRGSYIVFL